MKNICIENYFLVKFSKISLKNIQNLIFEKFSKIAENINFFKNIRKFYFYFRKNYQKYFYRKLLFLVKFLKIS